MDGFDNFLADLVRHEVQPEPGPTAAGTTPPGGRPARLVAQLLDEVVSTSVLIAVVTAIANAAEKDQAGSGAGTRRSGLALYAPTQSPYFQTLAEALLGSDTDYGICRALQAYSARLALAQRLIHAFAADPGQARVGNYVDPEIVADACRRACRAAIDCIEMLVSSLSLPAPGRADHDLHVVELLRSAAGGASPCLEPDGRVAIPGWAERRREERRQLQLAASAEIGRRVMLVMICDASRSGLGLACTHPASPGERIIVRLPGDRSLPGTVAWTDGHRIGVRLDCRLAPSDPLLAN